MALANGATACMSASSDVKLMFKGILAAETEKKAGAQAMKRGLDAAAKAAGGSSSSGSGSACKQLLLEINFKKRSVFHLSGNTQKKRFCLLC